jgi:hypothetical protein
MHVTRGWLVAALGIVAAILTGTSVAMTLNARNHPATAAPLSSVSSPTPATFESVPPTPRPVFTAAGGPALHVATQQPTPVVITTATAPAASSPTPSPAPSSVAPSSVAPSSVAVTSPEPAGTAPGPTPTQTAVPMPKRCGDWHCTLRQSIDLHNGYAVALWLTPAPQDGEQGNLDSRPYLELVHGTDAVQWLISPFEDGYGWSGTLSCDTEGPVPNCALVGASGAHSSYGVVVLLASGRLVEPAGGSAVADSSDAAAADLDGDGYLDIIGSMSDYRPDFADGTNYWDTFRFTSSGLVSTGCEQISSSTASAPTRLLTGSCPVR